MAETMKMTMIAPMMAATKPQIEKASGIPPPSLVKSDTKRPTMNAPMTPARACLP